MGPVHNRRSENFIKQKGCKCYACSPFFDQYSWSSRRNMNLSRRHTLYSLLLLSFDRGVSQYPCLHFVSTSKNFLDKCQKIPAFLSKESTFSNNFARNSIYLPDICPTGHMCYNIRKILSGRSFLWEFETRSVDNSR